MEAALVKKYEEILANDPSSRVFSQLGELYRKLGMLEQALNLYREGIKKHPSYTLGYMGLAFCYFDLEQFQLAYATLRPIVESARDNIRMQKLFAQCCEKLNYKEEALTTWKYLLFINPKDQEYSARVLALESGPTELVDELKYPQSFEVDKIHASPIDDVDDWIRMDLSETKSESTPSIELKKDTREENKEDESEQESPLMSLTLVDLYIAQGHTDKAKEVLFKMAELNPSDERIEKRLNEIDQNTVAIVEEESSEEDAHSKLLKMVEEKQNTFVDEDEVEGTNFQSVNLLDKFLIQIKQRAEQKSSQS